MSSTRNVAVADTLPPEEAVAPAPSIDGPPVPDSTRYEMLEPLGEGGMGVVYKARDRMLGRTIAIKFLRGADPNLMMRFLREAHAQARIDHPNICRVYDAGQVAGRAYILLQFVDGEPLHRAAARMSLDEKIAVMRDVTIALHEAHRLGIVHRDLKPGNVLVECSDDGRWFPIIMDFGLARETTLEARITESGIPLGTPAYMPPEQARGDIQAIDRRSDVYSLGATLYELLTERVPFPSASLATVLAQVLHEDPPAPRSLVPSIPVDLETIILKCLAKDPGQRYASARALADDLDRYLDGLPIVGRRLSLWQRARLRARRHRALVILAASALAVVLVVAGLAVRERALTAERAQLAARLGRETPEIEAALREAYLLPLHDTRPDRDHIRQRMRAIGATHHDLGELGDAMVHSARGRGHLALHEWREAADELGLAANGGLNTPELHAARGRALGELYRRALEDLRHKTGDEAWLAARQQDLARQYLMPARAEIEHSRASGDDAALLEARLALYHRDFATAERNARVVAERAVDSSEALRLAGDAAVGAADEALDHGDHAAARSGIERAAELYARASDIARSDLSLYQAAAEAWLRLAEIDFRQNRSPRESLDRALDAIDSGALRADPDDARAFTIKSYAILTRYRTASLTDDGDRRALLERSAQAAARAVELDPRDAHAWLALGNAHINRGSYEADSGRDAQWWRLALEEIGKALAIEPDDPQANNQLGILHRWLARDLGNTGGDPAPEYQAALRGYARAMELDPRYLPACTNQVDLYLMIAEHDEKTGSNPQAAVDSAREIGERCLTINSKFYRLLDNLAQLQLALAHYLVDARKDPMPTLRIAHGYLDRAEAVEHEPVEVWYHRGTAFQIAASFELDRQLDPTSSIAAGRAALAEALRVNPGSAYLYVEAARLDLVEAAWATRKGREPAPALALALADAEKAITFGDRYPMSRCTAAEVYLQIAMTRPSRAVVERGIEYANEALALDPQLRRATTVRAELQKLVAR
ncbi:MAG TPA: protein kinase [Kofleriaceae bacterium]|nr:protein kinase [Kofleriaceae bacterium]